MCTDKNYNSILIRGRDKCISMRGMCTKKIGALSQLGAEKITFPPQRG